MNNILIVFLGGGLGSIVRYGISEIVKSNFKSVLPLATFFSNTISCIILALAVGYFSDKSGLSPALRLLIVVGFCGGFSTFSTFSFETIELIKAGNTLFAIANVLISITVCMAIIYTLVRNN